MAVCWGAILCARWGGHGDAYLPEDFFKQVQLKADAKTLACDGETYKKISAHYSVNVPDKRLDIEAVPGDFIPAVLAADNMDASKKPVQPAETVPTMALQHSLSFWDSSVGGVSLSGALSGQYYSSVGLFSVDGQFSKDSNGFQQNLTDASWRRHFADYGMDGRFGLNTFWAAGTSLRLYGLLLGSDISSISNNSGIYIDGFADMPGRLQIRSKGVLVKEMQVSAGYFSVPTANLAVNMGGTGQYTLTLLDDSERVIKTWDVFVPVGAQILRPGAYDWKFFAGDIRNNLMGNAVSFRTDHLGAGLAYRYGVNRQLSVELMGVAGEEARGGALAFAYTPLPWLTLNGSGSRFSGNDSPASSSYLGAGLIKGNLSASAGIMRQTCFSYITGGSENCNLLQSSANYYSEKLGRFNFQNTRQLSGAANSNTGLSWSLPTWRTINLSFFANQQKSSGSTSSSFGFNVSLPLGGGAVIQRGLSLRCHDFDK